jgi:hypothetical protein
MAKFTYRSQGATATRTKAADWPAKAVLSMASFLGDATITIESEVPTLFNNPDVNPNAKLCIPAGNFGSNPQ